MVDGSVKCSGGCCGVKANDVSRRDFLTLIGAGAATAAIGSQAWANWLQQHSSPEELERWKKALMLPSPKRVYRSGVNTDARMHLGGIGTGNIEIGCDGQFTNWQLFNTLSDGLVPLMFAVKAGGATRLLQTAGGPDWPRVKQIEMTGEYPIATLRFVDADLPVKLELSAFTPFAPLDSRFLLDAAGRDGLPRRESDGREANGFAGRADAESGGLRRHRGDRRRQSREIRRQHQRAAPRRQGRRAGDASRAGQRPVARQAGPYPRTAESRFVAANGRQTPEESHRERHGKQPDPPHRSTGRRGGT